jgi:MerR family transcriptional regulator, thiopeptide resistance regulator
VSDGRWSIGQLARTSGVTVRTLYYYDEIGLVPPSERTHAGHRRYTEDDVRRLYRVRALTQLGLSLDEVAAVLGRGSEDLTALRDLLHAQLADLDAKSRRLAEVRQRVQGLIEQLDGAVMPEPERFLVALELVAPFHAHFSARQRDALAERRAELGADTVDALRAQWLTIIAELHAHLARGTPVEDAVVQELAASWRRIGDAFRTGHEDVDEELGASATALWQAHGTRVSRQLSDSVDWLAPDDVANIVDYVRRAWRVGPNER